MYLYGKRIRGKSISHPLRSLPECIEPEKLETLVKRFREGDSTVREEIILGHVRLVLSIAAQYSILSGRDADDYASEGIVAMIESFNSLPDNNITGWIVKHVHVAIVHYIERRRVRSNQISNITKYNEVDSEHPYTDVDIEEMIGKCSEIEQQIIRLRYLSYNDREIGEILHMDRKAVYRARVEVSKRFEIFITGDKNGKRFNPAGLGIHSESGRQDLLNQVPETHGQPNP